MERLVMKWRSDHAAITKPPKLTTLQMPWLNSLHQQKAFIIQPKPQPHTRMYIHILLRRLYKTRLQQFKVDYSGVTEDSPVHQKDPNAGTLVMLQKSEISIPV